MKKTVLLISQACVPDPAAVGQYMEEVALSLAADETYRVLIFTSARGYTDCISYPFYEKNGSVHTIRFPFSSFGKKNILYRIFAQLLFLMQAAVAGLFVRNLGLVLTTTSPPFGAIAGIFIRKIRSVRLVHWVMDLNPDQSIAMGVFKENSLLVKLFRKLNDLTGASVDKLIVLDQEMHERVSKWKNTETKLAIQPLWPLRECILNSVETTFRKDHDLEGKFIFLYAGNITKASPPDLILQTARLLKDYPQAAFVFLGGGEAAVGLREIVDKNKLSNVRLLPYQPLAELGSILSAADAHLVTLGEKMPGLIHPCKVYNSLALGKPLLYFGPSESFITRLISESNCGWICNTDNYESKEIAGLIKKITEGREVRSYDPELFQSRPDLKKLLIELE